MSWILLVIAILFEVSGTTFMKLSHGFTRRLPTILMFVFYGIGFVPLNLALRRLDVSVAYAVWSGLGTAIITAIGVFWFKEPVTAIKMVSIALIILGVIGLNLSSAH
jgi:small multidrug resistance pump